MTTATHTTTAMVTATATASSTSRSSAPARACAPSASRSSCSAPPRPRNCSSSSPRAAWPCSPTSSTTSATPPPPSPSRSPSRCAARAPSAGPGSPSCFAIFVSACVAGYEAIDRLLNPHEPEYLAALALAGAVGFAGNWWAASIRTRAGRRLDSPALIADGAHARADAYVSLAVIASAAAVALGASIADPLIGLAITIVILKITRDSWVTVRRAPAGEAQAPPA